MKLNRQEIIRLFMLLGIVIAIIMQIKVTMLIAKNQEAIETDPLVYAARKYNLPNMCACIIDEEKTILFNQSGSWTQIQRQHKPEAIKNLDINLSDVLKKI